MDLIAATRAEGGLVWLGWGVWWLSTAKSYETIAGVSAIIVSFFLQRLCPGIQRTVSLNALKIIKIRGSVIKKMQKYQDNV